MRINIKSSNPASNVVIVIKFNIILTVVFPNLLNSYCRPTLIFLLSHSDMIGAVVSKQYRKNLCNNDVYATLIYGF